MHTAKKISKKIMWLGKPFSKKHAVLDEALEKAGFDIDGRSYAAVSVFSALFFSLLIFVLVLSISIRLSMNGPMFGILSAVVFFFIIMAYNMKYPKLLASRRIKDIERNMLFSLKHMYVQVKSGVPLFSAIVSVSEGNYGEMSKEFRKIVKEVNTGSNLEDALEKAILENPSKYFRRMIWQLSNSLKSGVDISNTVEDIIKNLSQEQRIAIRRYGSQLNPLTLVYMMVAVIMPSLGITLLIVMSSLSGTSISTAIFWVILFGVGTFQFIYVGIIKSKRPTIS
jgi:flagellar protein FlaJ